MRFGGAYGIRTRGLRLERAVSLATRRMRHAILATAAQLIKYSAPQRAMSAFDHAPAAADVEGRLRFPYN